MDFKEESLKLHKKLRGKLTVESKHHLTNKNDLSLLYTPGVAEICKKISENKENLYEYTIKNNSVAVISDGSAVLGLGEIGPEAALPVMEGKAILLKRFAGVDAYPLCIKRNGVNEFVQNIVNLTSSFGAINLEDIKAPFCFDIEKKLKEKTNIPIFHDDQHGTAIVVLAGLFNSLKLVEKNIENIKIVIAGAGAAGFAVTKLLSTAGAKNIIVVDKKGVVYKERAGNDKYLEQLGEISGERRARNLKDAFKNSDVFIGVSTGDIVTGKMIKSMNKNPIIFALANPTPEISYYKAKKARDDAICATGRSDFPNQVNNVLGFPFIFRGALDVRAKKISDKMKIAAAQALAELARKPVPEYINNIYNTNLEFGPDYIIPKAFDHRILIYESFAVAKTALIENNFRKNIDLTKYKKNLEKLSEDLIQI